VRRYLIAIVGAALLALVAVIALAARDLPRANAAPRVQVRWDLVSFGIEVIMAGVALGFIIWLLLPGGRRRRRRRHQGRSSSIAGALILLAIFLLLLRLGGFDLEPATTTTTTVADAATTLTAGPAEPPPPVGSSFGLLTVVAAMTAVALALLTARRETPADEAETTERTRMVLADTLDDLLAELEASDDPRQIVIGAYARMEQALASAGLPRKRADSPRQYLAKVLRSLDVSERSAARLTDLFEEARYSPHDINASMASEAMSALREVRGQLGAVR
jgi:hypothetical protein